MIRRMRTYTPVWRKFCLQPHRTEGFKFSTDPQLEAKIRDVVGLYLEPPENAVVVCVDEKSQIQALDRTRPVLPMRPGVPERQTMTTSGTAPPPCSLPWKSPPARSPMPATPVTATASSSSSSRRSPAPTRARNCTSCATTTPPTSTPTSASGWPAAEPADHLPLRPHQLLVAQPGRGLGSHHKWHFLK